MTFKEPPLNQIAFSVTDLRRTHDWYQRVFGYIPTGGTRLFFGPIASAIQGVPKAASTCWWLTDQQDYFQLELFQFRSPKVQPLPDNHRPCDVGYSMVGIHVRDFDGFLQKLDSLGIQPLTPPKTIDGNRRFCIRDPEGVYLEIMEDDPRRPGAGNRLRPNTPVVTRSIRVSVPDLEKSRHYFVECLGLPVEKDYQLHTPEHEELWGLPGASYKSLLLWSGDFLIELVQYTDPVGQPWPDGYHISDQGLLNIALGFRSHKELKKVYKRCVENGYLGNSKPYHFGSWSVVYVNDKQGFSVELLFVRPWYDRFMGFLPRGKTLAERESKRKSAQAELTFNAPIQKVWDKLIDHEAMTQWWPFKEVRLIQPGDEDKNGPGAIREMKGMGSTLVEQVTHWNPPYSYHYRLVKGAPIKDHAGSVELTEVDGKTHMRWTINFNPGIPGTGGMTKGVLQKLLTNVMSKLQSNMNAGHS